MIPTKPNAASGKKLERSLLLNQWLHEFIRFQGPVGADTFMKWALYHPEWGYYNHVSHIGREGDFVTAPSLSPIFAESLVACFKKYLSKGIAPQVLEIGAGTGTLAQHFLTACAQESISVQYFIYEPSPSLRKVQENILPSHITWLDDWPSSFSGLVIANEVLDALPIKSLIQENGSFKERVIASDGEHFFWQHRAISPLLDALLTERNPNSFAEGQVFELSTEYSKWILQLGNSLDQALVFLFDYGDGDRTYYHTNRQDGTLRAFYEHQVLNDVLWQPGLCDITADVNFTDVAIAADNASFQVLGFTTQTCFLLENPVPRMQDLRHNFEMKELITPNRMGERFKVMALSKNLTIEPAFTHDLRHWL